MQLGCVWLHSNPEDGGHCAELRPSVHETEERRLFTTKKQKTEVNQINLQKPYAVPYSFRKHIWWHYKNTPINI